MTSDYRKDAAAYYDLDPALNDVPFYLSRVPSPDTSILELGCGTGRTLLPLSGACGHIYGVDHSEGMLNVCRRKLRDAGVPESKAKVQTGDITDLDLGRTFDLIVAPYWVIQNLETDAQLDGLFETVSRHLSPQGTCILNVWMPNASADEIRQNWVRQDEQLDWEGFQDGSKITIHVRQARVDRDNLILYPELVYRSYDGDLLVDESVLNIAMRCYYPEQFAKLVEDHGFEILERWGGYADEIYGEGPELVIQFTHPMR